MRREGASPDGVALVLAAAQECGVQARPAGPGEVRFLTPVTGVASVRRLERRLARRPAEQWPELVREHVTWLLAGAAVTRPPHARDWDEIRPLLQARLRPVGLARPDRLPTHVLRHAGLAVGEVLAIVADGAVTTVSRLAVPRWGVPVDVALQAGRDNVRRAGVLERHWDGPWLVLTGDAFTSAHVWWAHHEVAGDAGVLVALPTATTVLVASAEADRRAGGRLAELAEQARRCHNAAPDKLSPYVYRLVSGQLRLAAGVGADGRLHVPDGSR
ncbi:MAG: hypothetical protein ACXV5Q_06075 [Frankiaceae bacterium]